MKHWRTILARLPLPMLALAASYGVYSFALLFVPQAVAMIQAAAFELTYIGLAVTQGLSDGQRRRATAISVGAVVASIVYNTLSGWFHRQPELLSTASPIAWLMFAILHGAPLAWVAFLVADLLLHSGAQTVSELSKIDPVALTLTAPLGAAPALASPDGPGEAEKPEQYNVLPSLDLFSTALPVAPTIEEPTTQSYECPHCGSMLLSKQAKGSAARFGCENVACPGRVNRKEVRVIK